LLGTTKGHNIVEISYSIGIGIGIILFFNHFSINKSESELTPIQIEMRSYEDEMNTAAIKEADVKRKTKDV
jgi:stage V sporulation protein AA